MKTDSWLIHQVKQNAMQLNRTMCAGSSASAFRAVPAVHHAIKSGGALEPPACTVTKGLGRFAG